MGVREYWVIDPLQATVSVERRGDNGSLVPVARADRAAGGALSSPLLPGFLLSLDDVFSAVR